MIKVYQVTIPEYSVKSKPDWVTIGAKVDLLIKKYFFGKKVVIRCLGSQEHSKKKVGDLIKVIKKIGHDRYDLKRCDDRYENVEGKKIDIFALDFVVKSKTKIIENFIEPFYTWPPKFGNKPVRLDIVIIYDRSKLKRVLHSYEGRTDVKKDGFVFKNSNNKKDAILGIIKIL
ncbi:MAG: hypothetical protein U9R08_00070 [Nanoarchaeota archaeon]|nr:hypothetical protein [Nanoarchaeota archaeon]